MVGLSDFHSLVFNDFSFFFSDVNQRTAPPELPIFGDPNTEILLELVFPKGNPIFLLNEKSLQLLQPLDRDEENLSHIVFQVRHFNHFLINSKKIIDF